MNQNTSVISICTEYFKSKNQPIEILDAWYFCDNQKDADECAALVLTNTKRATATSKFWFELNDEPLPQVGDLNVVTKWNGAAQCIIRTTKIDIVPYSEIDETFAAIEGEGDKSLDYWRRVHWAYYSRELLGTIYKPSEDMLIVCEHFEVVFTK
jgi:uncharacterized protein YhfF